MFGTGDIIYDGFSENAGPCRADKFQTRVGELADLLDPQHYRLVRVDTLPEGS